MLSCRELTELVTDYLEGRLGFWGRARFQLHLGVCAYCRAYLRQIRDTIATLGRLPKELPAGPERDELLRRFRGWKSGGG